jgi:hypothetical protein
MVTTSYPASAISLGGVWPRLQNASRRRVSFGDAALAVFLLTQFLDGLYTYLGVLALGIHVEANPLVAALMVHFGHGTGLLGAKLVASSLGICLYLRQIHTVVALLAGLYLTAAIAPWTVILFF